MTDRELLRQILESTLAGVDDSEEIRQAIYKAGSDLNVRAEVLEELAREMVGKLAPPPAAGPAHRPAASPEDQPPPEPPKLRIDWGLGFRVGINLTPKFQLICPGFRSRPHVTLPPDKRLECADWRECPRLLEEDESHWTFNEPVRLTEEGQYRLEFRAVFQEPDAPEPWCYRGEVVITVTDPTKQAGPTLEVEADDAGVIDMPSQDISGYSRVVAKVTGRGLVRIKGTSPGDRRGADDAGFVVELPLMPDREMQRRMPWLSPHGRRQPMDSASLLLPTGRRILLLARRRVVFGRNQQFSDVVLRLEPLDEERQVLSRQISRKHFFLEFRPEGLLVEDVSQHGTFVENEHVHQAVIMIPHSARYEPHVLGVGGIVNVELTMHRDPAWASASECLDVIESQYCRAVGGSFSRAWQYARQNSLDAVRLCRRKHLPVRNYLPHLADNLKTQPDLLQKFRRAVSTIDLVDHLAGKEEYVLVFRTATVGGTDSDAIHLPGAGLSAAHARIFHIDGCFWLEHLHEYKPTTVDGQPIAPHELVPLAPGMKLRFGQMDVVFDHYQRIKLPV